ncbi:MAG: amidohydrolase/deacetylase family metallohydrolase [Daejeonella sp.]|uniref:amidohydrolase/deacetylase family metallohydrolase n=1 Tax=Daejeonella sp. TaxID=2805397 RepID=UPI002736F5A1|nr:amidohydrolase/deacetylase family metallohydrolase [Daejeonella sp.]MDP3469138.1 amidohydrolase/deacetylase family metallohydrolase [Daejeonella sp.]
MNKLLNLKWSQSWFFTVRLMTGLIFFVCAPQVKAQDIDLLLKGGHVIDAKNNIDRKMDVAVKAGKIFRVAADIPASSAKKVLDVSGLIVAPGLINMHTHVYAGSNPGFTDGTSSQLPDAFAPRSGITTVVDAGTTGWRTFPDFKAKIIDNSMTRVLAFLSIAASGYSVDKAQENIAEMDVQKTTETVNKYPDILVGVRIGRYDGTEWTPFDRASEAAKIVNKPLFVECHLPMYSLEDQLNRMRAGDIITHAFENVSERMTVVDEQGKVRPFVLAAQKRGVLFDVGHGGGGFWFNQGIPSFKQGLWPNSFGTDEHRTSMNSGMKTMLNVMSKYLNMGMTMPEIIARGSWNAAKSIKREDLGNLSEGSVADIAVLSVLNGKFGFVDSGNNRIEGNKKFEAELTVRAGRIIWDLNGLAANPYK